MKKLTLLVLFLSMASAAVGEVSTRVCLYDGNTPLELADANFPFKYRDIMVGTELTIIVSSDTEGYWTGDLAITGEDMNYGVLSCRDLNDTTGVCGGSCFPEAGTMASVILWEEAGIYGFQLLGHSSAVAGDWFIIDYNAIAVGDCNVGFYEEFELVYELSFSHVRTRDFNNDTKVDFADFALFGSYWQAGDCIDPNWCEGADLDTSGNVDVNDLALFADYWVERTQ